MAFSSMRLSTIGNSVLSFRRGWVDLPWVCEYTAHRVIVIKVFSVEWSGLMAVLQNIAQKVWL